MRIISGNHKGRKILAPKKLPVPILKERKVNFYMRNL